MLIVNEKKNSMFKKAEIARGEMHACLRSMGNASIFEPKKIMKRLREKVKRPLETTTVG